MQQKHVPTARGRVLAAGDVDPAAGSRPARDEPTRLNVEDPVAERKQAFEVQVTTALFLKSINWVQALPPTLKRSHCFGTRGRPFVCFFSTLGCGPEPFKHCGGKGSKKVPKSIGLGSPAGSIFMIF